MNTRFKAMVAALGLVSLSTQADDLLIRGATLHTMGEKGVIENADILIRDGVIKSIGRNVRDRTDEMTIIEAEGRPVTPGFFAGISGIGITEVSAVDETVDNALKSLNIAPMHPEFEVATAYNPHSSLVPVTRIEGYSFTLLSASVSGSLLGGQGRIVALDGDYDSFQGAPVLFVDIGGRAASRTGGSRAGQWMLLRQLMREAQDGLEAGETGLLTPEGRSVLQDFMDGGRVIFSVNRASDILRVLAFAEEMGVQAVIAGGAEAWMVAAEIAAAKVPVLLNPFENLPSSFDALGARLDNAALLQAAGIDIAMAGSGSHNARKLRQMAGNAVANGLPYEAALASLTANPAMIFGVEDAQGRIVADRPANLVLWSGDPLEVTTVAEQVIINGRRIPMRSRQTDLRDRYLPEQPDMPRAYIKP